MRPLPVAFALLLSAFSAGAQDVLTIGTGSAATGASAQVPISILDRSGTPLGNDATAIRGFAFKVMFDEDAVTSMTFARAGIAASTPVFFESTLQGDGWISVVVSFSQPLTLDLNTIAPGNPIGTLNVNATSTTSLRFDPPGAVISNQTGSVLETVAAGNLALVNGSVTITGPAPTNLVATAAGTAQVNLTWSPLAGASSYEVWRSFNGSAYSPIATPSANSFSDTTVSANTTYLYKVKANTSEGFSNVDAATTVVFTDDPLVAGSTIVKLVHVTELRTAVNAMRASAGMSTMSADGTIAAGAIVRAQHVSDLRTALSEARAVLGLGSVTFTDSTLIVIKAVHVEELRAGVE